MPAIVASLGNMFVNMLLSLVTETFVKQVVVLALREVVARTQNEIDNKLLKAAEEAWGVSNEKPE